MAKKTDTSTPKPPNKKEKAVSPDSKGGSTPPTDANPKKKKKC